MMVRRATLNEAQALWTIRNEAIRFGCRDTYPEDVLAAWTPDEMPEGYRNEIVNNPFFVADNENGEPVATGFLDLKNGSVEAIFTLPAWTGRGLAKQILQAIKQEARSRGMSRLTLSSTPNARDFYLKQGFRVVKEGLYPMSRSGTLLRCYEMVCELDPDM
ncbi:GNAT family N-acetyltransferase [Cedecea neteri]|uniref:GCN5 family acetyltransferase n=1 Tax=Cedecea neteri TaxID=158822 RepID=A0AAN0S6Y6_9ENTR|nr:GNAT family N-acetyltransferase [Cedecea neteri]AIR62399.1 GCN5 family acetyltransferase [Cedecea neteri]WNJ81764.1 GNAT family N-acetyltransferase [Cedecea neteri]